MVLFHDEVVHVRDHPSQVRALVHALFVLHDHPLFAHVHVHVHVHVHDHRRGHDAHEMVVLMAVLDDREEAVVSEDEDEFQLDVDVAVVVEEEVGRTDDDDVGVGVGVDGLLYMYYVLP